LRHTDAIIRRAAKGIFGGDTGICPSEGACAYCDYADICLINEAYDGNTVRPVPRVDKENLMEALGNE
jgi:ATP-dependent helicase/DNAse subunit B